MVFKKGHKLNVGNKFRVGKTSWNKGTKGISHGGFQKGHEAYAGTEETRFKTGRIPWNKDKGKHPCANCGMLVMSYIKYCSKKCCTMAQIGKNTWSKGRKLTEAHRLKVRLAKIKYVENTRLNGMPLYPTIGKYEKQILDSLECAFGYGIERQKKVAGYFLDGYCSALNLAIEIDGEYHKKTEVKDMLRDQTIKRELGCMIMRIPIGGECL